MAKRINNKTKESQNGCIPEKEHPFFCVLFARCRKKQEANAAFAEANQAVNVNVNVNVNVYGNGNEYVNENVVVAIIIIIIATAMMTTTTTNRSQIPLFAMNEKSIWRLRKGLLLCAYHCHYRRRRALQNL